MKLSLRLPFLLLTFIVCASLGNTFSLHRTKRDLDEAFLEKHVKFVSEGTPITFNFLKQKLPGFADNKYRLLHTFIIVFLNNTENEEKQKVSFWTMLNTLMSKQIRSDKCREKAQNTLYVCKTPIENNKPKYTGVKLSGYRLCQIRLKDLGPKTYMANFNPQNKTGLCKYSAQGTFELGAGLVENIVHSDMNTDWFIVNHLEKSKMIGKRMDCKK